MSQLAIYLFGPPRIEVDDVPISVDTRKAIALAAYLAVMESVHSRHHLTKLLWTEKDPGRARAALRRTLSVLRKALGNEWLIVDRDRIGLSRGDSYWSDVCTLRQHLAACQTHGHAASEVCPACIPILTQAVDLCRQGFMADFYLRDPVLFDTWQVTEAEYWLREQGGVLEKLVQHHVRQREFETAVMHARSWLMLDPTREAAHRTLMMLYLQMGQRAAALRQYEECVLVLEQTLGVAPAAETKQLLQLLRDESRVDQVQAPVPLLGDRSRPDSFADAHPAIHSLPLQFVPCIGREVELAEVSERLSRPHCHILTITGMGGIGKTRLAIQVAGQLADRFADGVYFVPLAPVASTYLLETAVADALQLPHSTSLDPRRHLLNYLQEKQILLVLDNFEHLLERAELLLEIVRQAPQVKLLVTSRACLNFRAEWLYELDGLPYPVDGELDEAWDSYSAVQLFLFHARRVRAGFGPDQDDKAAILNICRLLQGLPLGIELAAAAMRTSTAAELAAQISENLDLMITTMRDVPSRHRSLRAVFMHSWRLLATAEQEVLARLSIFRGSFTLAAAQRVALAAPAAVRGLVDNSFLREMLNGRYEMHPLLQQFAREELGRQDEDGQRVHERYLRHFTEFLQQRSPQLKAGKQKESLRELSLELEHIRAAWQFAHRNQAAAASMELVEGLYLFYELSSRYYEGVTTFGQALESYSGPEQGSFVPLRGSILARLGSLNMRLCRYGEAREQLQSGLALLRTQAEQAEAAFASYRLGILDFFEGRIQEAEASFRDSLAQNEINDEWLKAQILNGLGNVYRVLGDYERSDMSLQQALSLCRRLDNQVGAAVSLNNLGINAEFQGKDEEAKQLYQESLALKLQIGDRKGIAHARLNLGYTSYRLQRYDEAKELLTESLAEFRELGVVAGVAMSLTNLGNVARAVKQYPEAKRLYNESLLLFTQMGSRREIVFSLSHLAEVATAMANYEDAKRYFSQALTLATEINTVPQVLEAMVGIGQFLLKCGKKEEAVQVLRYVNGHPTCYRELADQAQALLLEFDLPDTTLPARASELTGLSLAEAVSSTLAMLA